MSLKTLVQVVQNYSKENGVKISQSLARGMIKKMIEHSTSTLKQKGKVSIYGLGSLTVRQSPQRKIFHVQKKEVVEIPPSKRIRYRAPSELKKGIQTTKITKVAKKPAPKTGG